MPRTSLEDPFSAFRFRIEIDGFARTGFSGLSGVEMTIDVIEYREGGDNLSVRKSPGLASHGPATLRRGIIFADSSGPDMFTWAAEVADVLANQNQALAFRRDLDLIALTRSGGVGGRWRLYDCWPSKYKATDVGGQENEHMYEELELQYEGLTRLR